MYKILYFVRQGTLCDGGNVSLHTSKLSFVLNKIAMDFVAYSPCDKIETINNMSIKYQVGRGTVQNAIKILEDSGAISLDVHGQCGTELTRIDYGKLFEMTGINLVIGSMPLPHTARYEGLATGIYDAMNRGPVSFQLSFSSSSGRRIHALLNNRCDFVITSLLTARHQIDNGCEMDIVYTLGPRSYGDGHYLIINKENINKDVLKIGIDRKSHDQLLMLSEFVSDDRVELVELPYLHIMDKIREGTIDGTVWSKESPVINEDKFIFQKLIRAEENIDDTVAAVLIRKEDAGMRSYLLKYFDPEAILKIQHDVLEKKMLPEY